MSRVEGTSGLAHASDDSRSFDQRLPLVISVTGHRDPQPAQHAELADAVARVLSDLDDRAPHTPFLVLSPLAEGCDRIFAQACLHFRGRRRQDEWRDLARDPSGGIRLVAPLPMEQAEYEHDFTSPESLEEFRSLLASADYSFPISAPSGIDCDGLAEERVGPHGPFGPHRNRQYERLGHFLAMQSNVVVAMWDGVREQKPGGTSAVVALCEEGRVIAGTVPLRDTVKELEPPEPTPVVWIPTRRARGTGPADGSYRRSLNIEERIYLARHAPSTAQTVEHFEVSRAHPDSPVRLLLDHASWIDRINLRLAEREGSSESTTVEEGLPYPLVNFVAMRMKKQAERQSARFIVLVTITILFLQAATAWSYWPLPALYLLGLLAVWARLRLLRRSKVVADASDLRLLFEAIRVQHAWDEAGIEEQVADHYLAHRSLDRSLLPIRKAMRAVWFRPRERPSRALESRLRSIGKVRSSWIEGQLNYFKKHLGEDSPRRRAVLRQARTARMAPLLVVAFALLTLALSVALQWRSEVSRPGSNSRADVGTASADASRPASSESPVSDWPTSGTLEELLNLTDFLCGAALTIALAFSLWQRVGREKEDLEHFGLMERLFTTANERLGECLGESPAAPPASAGSDSDPHRAASPVHAPGLDRARAILRAIGKEALDEQAAWHALHRETLDELPVG